jgi:hypothetical protein
MVDWIKVILVAGAMSMTVAAKYLWTARKNKLITMPAKAAIVPDETQEKK